MVLGRSPILAAISRRSRRRTEPLQGSETPMLPATLLFLRARVQVHDTALAKSEEAGHGRVTYN